MAAKVISFRLTDSTIARLDVASKHAHLSRTAVLEYAFNLFVLEVKQGTIAKTVSSRNYEDYLRNRVLDALKQVQ